MKHKRKLIKSAKARVTGTIPYCHGKVPPTEAACQGNSSETTEQNFMKLGR
jgi:hypothetical protein